MDSTVNPVEVDGETATLKFLAAVVGKTPKDDFELLLLLGWTSPFLLPNPIPPPTPPTMPPTDPGPVTV